jgi:uncharacterized membrane protein YccC
VAALYRALADWLAGDQRLDDHAPIFLALAHARDVLGTDPGPAATADDAGAPLRELVRLADLAFGELVVLRAARGERSDGDGNGGGPVGAASAAIAETLTTVAGTLRRRRPRAERRDAARRRLAAAMRPAPAPGRPGQAMRATPASPEPAPVQRRADALTGYLDEALTLATSRPGGAVRDGRPDLRGRRLRATVAANLTLRSSAFRHAVRLAVTVTAAITVARALNLPHGYWAPLTVLWLPRPDFGSTFTRGLQRYAGTTVGAIAATVLAATLHPGPYALAATATVLAVGILAFMRSNYALTAICTTGWVVFVSALAGIPELRAGADRLLDTSIGAALTLGVYLLWPTWERPGVPAAIADLIEADRGYAIAAGTKSTYGYRFVPAASRYTGSSLTSRATSAA